MAGRPEFKPTEEQSKLVMVLTGAGFIQKDIALLITDDGIDLKTLRKHFKKELKLGKLKTNAKIAGKLLMIFWAKTQMGWKTTEKHELTGPDGKPIPIITTNMSPQEAAKIYAQEILEQHD